MNRIPFIPILLSVTLLQALARENIRTDEQSGIPEKADVDKEIKEPGKEKEKEAKMETRENQEETDPVFYDSTTSPGEMEKDDEN